MAQVNWPTLWMSWRERELREIIVLPIIVLIMLVPVGAFSGAASAFADELSISSCVSHMTPYLLHTLALVRFSPMTPKELRNIFLRVVALMATTCKAIADSV